jgi:hypothetical protein
LQENIAAGRLHFSDLFDILGGVFRDTSLEPDLDDLLWHLADLFHKKAARAQRQLEDNEDRQSKSQEEQDGSEVRSVELESLIAQGETLLDRRAAFEHMRDLVTTDGRRDQKKDHGAPGATPDHDDRHVKTRWLAAGNHGGLCE